MIVVSRSIEATCVQLFDRQIYILHTFILVKCWSWVHTDWSYSWSPAHTHLLCWLDIPCDFSKTFVHALSQNCRRIATCCMIQVQRRQCANILYICKSVWANCATVSYITIWHDSPYMVHDLHYFSECIITVGHRPNSEQTYQGPTSSMSELTQWPAFQQVWWRVWLKGGRGNNCHVAAKT